MRKLREMEVLFIEGTPHTLTRTHTLTLFLSLFLSHTHTHTHTKTRTHARARAHTHTRARSRHSRRLFSPFSPSYQVTHGLAGDAAGQLAEGLRVSGGYMVGRGLGWFGLVWFGLVWFGLVWL